MGEGGKGDENEGGSVRRRERNERREGGREGGREESSRRKNVEWTVKEKQKMKQRKIKKAELKTMKNINTENKHHLT